MLEINQSYKLQSGQILKTNAEEQGRPKKDKYSTLPFMDA